jgi:GMP synthase (glutamine-hydrolysing)
MQEIGILNCGQVRDDLVGRHGEYPDMFARLLRDIEPALRFRSYRVFADELPAVADAHACWLISGSRCGVYDDEPWIRRLETFVRTLHTARRPAVGICFGHQMMARALGGVTAKAPQGWGIGRHVASVLATPSWMQPAAAEYGLFHSHQDQVLTLPPGAERLARSAHCANAMFVVDDLFLGIQGHPEFSADYARELAAGRADIYGAEVLARALPTWKEPADSALVARWILAFLDAQR